MDRFYRGLMAGIAGGILMNIWDLTAYHLFNFGDLRFLDWASVIIYGHLPKTTFQAVYAQIMQILWVGFLGVLFAFLVPKVTSRGYLGKGVFFGILSGFIIYAVPVLFRVPNLAVFSTETVISDHVGGIIWGLTLAYLLRLLDTVRT